MLNAAVTEPVLNRPRIMTRIGQRVAAAMAKHVGVNLERHSGAHRGNSRVARATAKDKSTSVVADAGRLPEIAGKEVEKR